MKSCSFLVFGVALLSLAFTGLSAVASPMNAMITEVTGKAEYADPGSVDFKLLVKGATLPTGSIIRTGADGVVICVPVRGAALRLAQNTEVTVSNMDFALDGSRVTSRKADIDLSSGTVTALLDESISPDVTDFKIRTPQGIASARGTFYAVCVHNDKSYVKVKAGKVGVQTKVTNPAGQASEGAPAVGNG